MKAGRLKHVGSNEWTDNFQRPFCKSLSGSTWERYYVDKILFWSLLFGTLSLTLGCVSPKRPVSIPDYIPSVTKTNPIPNAHVKPNTMLNIRAGPGTQHNILGTLIPDTPLFIREKKGSWCKVDTRLSGRKVQGWVSRKYILESEALTRDLTDTQQKKSRQQTVPKSDQASFQSEKVPGYADRSIEVTGRDANTQTSGYQAQTATPSFPSPHDAPSSPNSTNRPYDETLTGTYHPRPESIRTGRTKPFPFQNPLRGIELDLTVLDQMVALLKLNDIVLYRIEVSSEAEWPEKLERSLADMSTTELDCLDRKLRYDFSYFDLYRYRLVKLKKFSLSSISHVLQESIAVKLGRRLEYTKLILGNQTLEPCKVKPKRIRDVCRFFDEPTEVAIFKSLIEGKLERFLEEKIFPECLVRSVAISDTLHTNYNNAMKSLLSAAYRVELEEIERELNYLISLKAKLLVQKKWLEAKTERGEKQLQHTSRRSIEWGVHDTGQNLQAVSLRLKELEQPIKRQIKSRKKTLRDAARTFEITPRNVAFARKLQHIAAGVNQNLDAALGWTTLLLSKAAVDISKFNEDKLNLQQITYVMALESVDAGLSRSMEEGFSYAGKRMENIGKRILVAIPNIVLVTTTIASQKNKITQDLEYLNTLVAAGKWETSKGHL